MCVGAVRPKLDLMILSARNLVMTYGIADTASHALAGGDLDIDAGSLAVMGPSGSGKSTLLHCLAGIQRPTAGSVVLRGTDLTSMSDRERTALRRTDFGFVFQSGQLVAELPAVENAALPLMLDGTGRKAAIRRAAGYLALVGLAGLEGRRPGELSGGQAQRVAIARALVTEPSVVFADEPTGALDQSTGEEILHVLVRATSQAGAALVVVTHDPAIARHCARTVVMRDGRIVAEYHARPPVPEPVEGPGPFEGPFLQRTA
ncbi:ABC transporter ATP-binding protein [Microlunatus endophyticus]|uniref:ABC transporter ATP-binding protein n=2 Tax=Microlunatus endophyticus TaxID=1716077 RepID=A0A917W9N5_9ACTN|nr:ABC transporter ATP-binding protein [Microlunatus endophyticus]